VAHPGERLAKRPRVRTVAPDQNGDGTAEPPVGVAPVFARRSFPVSRLGVSLTLPSSMTWRDLLVKTYHEVFDDDVHGQAGHLW
jgi:hypothetical protein